MSLPTEVQKILEAKYGAKHNRAREDRYKDLIMQCPPIDPMLLDHLDVMFADPDLKAHNPLLGQLLTVQHGINLLRNYLRNRYNAQSAMARRENAR